MNTNENDVYKRKDPLFCEKIKDKNIRLNINLTF